MITSSSKVTHKSRDVAVCSIDFENLISLNPGRSGFCSSSQCCRTQLVLQLCQLHHLLTCFGLEVNHCWCRSVSRWSRGLIQSRARRRGRPVRHLAAIWCLYAGVGPARQVIGVVMDATTLRTRSAPVYSLPSSISCDSVGDSAIAIAAASIASSLCPRLCILPRLRAYPSPPRAPPSFPPLGWTRSPRGERHFASSSSSGSRPSRPRFRRTSSLLCSRLLSSLWVALRSA